MAAAATSGPRDPRRFAPGAPPPRTSARLPAKTAAVEAAAAVVAAPPPRPPEPPTRTSPNRGHGGFVTQAGQGRGRAGLGHYPRLSPRRTPGPHAPARATAPRSPSRSCGPGPTIQAPDLARPHAAASPRAHPGRAAQDRPPPPARRPQTRGRHLGREARAPRLTEFKAKRKEPEIPDMVMMRWSLLSSGTLAFLFLWWEQLRSSLVATLKFIIQYCCL